MSVRSFTLIPLFSIFLITSFSAFGQNRNQLEEHVLGKNKELVLVVVDAEGFAGQDDLSVNYKSRHHANVKWFMKNWYTFSKSVREKKSYRIKLNSKTYQTLSSSQKLKLKELYDSCYTGVFDPVGIANIQLSRIAYKAKIGKDSEQSYQKQQLTEEDISAYARNNKTMVLVLNKQIANQITAILAK